MFTALLAMQRFSVLFLSDASLYYYQSEKAWVLFTTVVTVTASSTILHFNDTEKSCLGAPNSLVNFRLPLSTPSVRLLLLEVYRLILLNKFLFDILAGFGPLNTFILAISDYVVLRHTLPVFHGARTMPNSWDFAGAVSIFGPDALPVVHQ